MKRIVLLGMIAGLLAVTNGCIGTAVKSGYREFKQFSVSYMPYEANDESWGSRYETLRIDPLTDVAINGRAPAELKSKVAVLAGRQVAESGLFRSVNSPEMTGLLIARGDIVHFDSGGMGATRTVGFGESPMLVVRTTFIDGTTGETLATANIVSKAESALQDWSEVVSRGHGAALVKYLKETQKYDKLSK